MPYAYVRTNIKNKGGIFKKKSYPEMFPKCLYRIHRCTKFCLKNFNVRNFGSFAGLIFFNKDPKHKKFQNVYSYHPQLSDSKFTCDPHGGLRLAVSCWIMGLLDRNVRQTIEKKFISDR